MIGTDIKQYHLLDKLGEGGGGTIYKAEDTLLNRTVAVKILPASLTDDENARKRFLREARLASRLDHPNICTIYSIEEADGFYFIVMQYVEGRTLKQVINHRPLEFDSVYSIALQIADAITYAHGKGIMHRDIKPTNIMITDRGQVKILDFGLAKLTDIECSVETTELTQQGAHLGTPAYMSPEQARCEEVDHRTDVFSLGIVIYEMATGQKPFMGPNSVEVMHAIMNARPKPMQELNNKVPAGLQRILDRALQKSPGDRYQLMSAMLVDLKALGRELKSGGIPDGAGVPYAPIKSQKSGWLSGTVSKLRDKLSRRPREDTNSQRGRSTAPELSTDAAASISKKAIAILPFKNISADPANSFYGFSLADSIITELAALRSLVVRPSSYVAKYQDKEIDPGQVGKELAVDAVLIGGFIKVGNRFRVTPQLVDIATGAILWSDKIDVEYEDIIKIQDEISQRIVDGLRLKISEDEQRRLARSTTASAEAYESYLRGRDHFFKFLLETANKADADAAIAAFKRAIELDSNYALAYSALGTCYTRVVLTGLGGVGDYDLAAQAYHKALQIDDKLIEPQLYLIYGQLLRGEKQQVRDTIKRLLVAAPNEPRVHNVAADIARWDGQYDKALREYARWLKLSPREEVKVLVGRCRIFAYKGRYKDAIAECEKALKLEPDHAFVRSFYAFTNYYLGDCEKSIAMLTQVVEEQPQMQFPKIFLAICLYKQGEIERAKSLITPGVIAAAEADGDIAYWLAGFYALQNKAEEALKWLERAIHMGNENYPWFANDPNMDNVRKNPRFIGMMEALRSRWEQLTGGRLPEKPAEQQPLTDRL
ncbi:MAG TPA: protein kinase [Blastocatellia bacterium]|nr:protein kinase [Blastocatellia bacterium]